MNSPIPLPFTGTRWPATVRVAFVIGLFVVKLISIILVPLVIEPELSSEETLREEIAGKIKDCGSVVVEVLKDALSAYTGKYIVPKRLKRSELIIPILVPISNKRDIYFFKDMIENN
jgi:hypothetical protein